MAEHSHAITGAALLIGSSNDEAVLTADPATAAVLRLTQDRSFFAAFLAGSIALHLCVLAAILWLEHAPPLKPDLTQEIPVDLVAAPPSSAPAGSGAPHQADGKSKTAKSKTGTGAPKPAAAALAAPKPESKSNSKSNSKSKSQPSAPAASKPPAAEKAQAQPRQAQPPKAEAPKPAPPPPEAQKPPPPAPQKAPPQPAAQKPPPQPPAPKPPEAAKPVETQTVPKPPPPAPPPPPVVQQPLPRPLQPPQATTKPASAQLPTVAPAVVPTGTPEGRPQGLMQDDSRAVAMPKPTDDGDEIVGYRSLVFGMLEENKELPEDARRRGVSGTAFIYFELNDDGSVKNEKLLESSGDAALDVESLALVQRAAPFPKPPPGAPRIFAAHIIFPVPE